MIWLPLESLPQLEGKLTCWLSEWTFNVQMLAKETARQTYYSVPCIKNMEVPKVFNIGNLSRSCALISEYLQLQTNEQVEYNVHLTSVILLQIVTISTFQT